MEIQNRRELYDEDLLPWGKHAGTALSKVPISYWDWFMRQDWCDAHPNILDYLEANYERIKSEQAEAKKRKKQIF